MMGFRAKKVPWRTGKLGDDFCCRGLPTVSCEFCSGMRAGENDVCAGAVCAGMECGAWRGCNVSFFWRLKMLM